jgi:hypothetical protein
MINPAPLLLALTLLATSPALADPLPLNPAVTQATIAATICRPGWTRKIRPRSIVARRIKRQMLAKISEPARAAPLYQLDHRIPLALGGARLDRRNLALQPIAEAHRKDAIELCLNWAVCAGELTLPEAQTKIWTNWRHAEHSCEGNNER